MNRLVICVAFVGISVIGNYAMGQDENLPTIVSTLENKYLNLQLEQDQMEVKVKSLLGRDADLKQQLLQLQKDNAEQQSAIDSLHTKIAQLSVTQSNDRTTFNEQIEKMNTNVQANETSLYQRTLWGGLIGLGAILILIVALYLLSQRLKKGHSSIEEMKKAQGALLSAQTKLQEESVQLDNKLLEVIGKQIATTPTLSVSDSAKPDYSLVLKVADEIVRIEMNLSRMDASVKGYKQLAKAVQRIKDNFQANGYEIVDMLGKSYNAGMKVIANFVVDETLEQGQQVITGIIKPQINFNGTMIQSAQITVSQNI